METQQIIQSLSYITWVLLAGLAVGSFALVWALRQTTDATSGFLSFSGFLAGVIGIGWLFVEWGLPAPTELAIEATGDLDEPRRAAIAVFVIVAFVAGILWRGGHHARWVGLLGSLAGLFAFALAAYDWTGGDAMAVPVFVQLTVLAAVTGGSMVGVVLSHWYLVTPRISERPLVLTTQLLMVALVLQLLLYLVWLAAGFPDQDPFEALTGSNAAFVWLRLIVGIIFPLVLTAMAYRTALSRSMESATGLLYIVFAVVLASTIVAGGLLLGEGLLV